MTWMFLVLLYGILKGVREIAKKLALDKNSVMEVLVAYTVISFMLCFPQINKAMGMAPKYYGFIAIKSFTIFLAWICSFIAIKKIPVSAYGILDLSRVLFSTGFGVLFLGEVLNGYQIAGLFVVCGGLLMLKFKPKPLKLGKSARNKTQEIEIARNKVEEIETARNKSDEIEVAHNEPAGITNATWFYVMLALISCFLNAISAFLDKVLMKDITTSQMQFWYMAFLVFYYFLYCLFTKTEVKLSVWKNGWVWLMAIIFVIGDRALFIANANPQSRITVMTLLKQCAVIITILGGKFIFKEKNIAYKLFCAAVVIAGIVLGAIK